jgi:hypothetical protein
MMLGLAGFARSGKDTVAQYLVEKHGFVQMAFADPMREALRRLDPFITVGEMNHVSLSSAVEGMGWEEVKRLSPDVRGLLQRMGTEVGRNMFGEDFWVDYAIGQSWKHDNVVFSDVRFQNEAYLIERNWGHNWRINRPGVAAANDHPSEHDLDSWDRWDAVLDNDGSLESLFAKVDLLIEEQKD